MHLFKHIFSPDKGCLRSFRGTCVLFFLAVCLCAQGQTNFPILKSIRFNLKGNPQLSWIDPGNNGVYIQRYVQPDGRDYLKIDSVRNILHYTDTLIRVHSGHVAYNLAPWIANEGYPLSKHISIDFSASFSTCDDRLDCRWTPYSEIIYEGNPRWTQASYQIWGRSLQDSSMNEHPSPAFELWANIPDSTLSFRVSTPAISPYYQLQIRAINALGDTATSPYVTTPHRVIEPAAHMQIDSILQQQDSLYVFFQLEADTAQMQWDLLLKAKTDSLALPLHAASPRFRTLSIALPASFLAPENRNYSVELRGKNTCNQVIMHSDPVYTLSLTCEQWNTGYHLDWDAPCLEDGIQYKLFRNIRNSDFLPLASHVLTREFTDVFNDVPGAPPIGSQSVCYRMEACYPQGCRVFNHISACAVPDHQVTMPNAIAPLRTDYNATTGKSRNLFEPVGNSIAEFHLLVLDRNGKIIYSGTAPWNGKQNNNANFALEGSYSYVCKIRFFDDSKKTLSGTLTVVY